MVTGAEIPLVAAAMTAGTTVTIDRRPYIKRKLDYARKIKKNLEKLESETRCLHGAKVETEKLINQNPLYLEEADTCKTWRDEVEKIEKEVEALKTRYENAHKSLWRIYTFWTLSKLGRDIVKNTQDVTRQLERKPKKDDMMIPRAAGINLITDAKDTVPSLSEHVDTLLTFLLDEEVHWIGIWGMPGVDKTTIMEKLNDKVSQTDASRKVFRVEAHEEDTVRNIQHNLVDWLGLPEQHKKFNKMQLGDTISRVLSQLKYLLLIDKVSSAFNLRDVGIRKNHVNGKVVIATGSKSDCNEMNVDDRLHVERLSNADALTLVRQIVGDDVDRLGMEATAIDICKQLGGLAKLIQPVARNLRDMNESVWHETLRTLKATNVTKSKDLAEVLTAFKLLYDKLPSDAKKKCLLYGALFPKDFEIEKDYLIECWRAERFIPENQQAGTTSSTTHGGQTLRVARDSGNTILQVLINACLMERCSRAKYVRMPAIFRMKALEIPYPQEEGCSSLVRAGEKLENITDEAEWKEAKRVSFMCNEIRSLCIQPECCQISTLLLQWNKELQKIHDSFFDTMDTLQVLDLSHTGVQSLPSSVFKVRNLKGLHLNNCENLVTLSDQIVKLTNLEVLDIRHTGIHKLPNVIGELVWLRSLKLGFICRNTSGNHDHQQGGEGMIPPNVIDKLAQLEELTVVIDHKDPRWNDIADKVADEVASLTKLNTLFFYFPNEKSLATFIENCKSWNNKTTQWKENSFRCFQFDVGSQEATHGHELDSSRGPVERHLKYSTSSDEELSTAAAVTEILKQARAFELIGYQGVQNLSMLDPECVRYLEVCILEDCQQMVSIVNANSSTTSEIAFRNLETLRVINLKSLKCIGEGTEKQTSLRHLSNLTLNGCHSLRNVISRTLIEHLPQLKYLRVENCSSVTDIIEADNQSEEIVVEVQDPIMGGKKEVQASPTTGQKEVHDEAGKKEVQAPPRKIWQIKKKSKPPLPKKEEVQASPTGQKEVQDLSRLQTLELVKLPNLARICDQNDSLGWRSLQVLEITDCDSLQNLSTFSNAKQLSKIYCDRTWWDRQDNTIKDELEKRCDIILPRRQSAYGTPLADRGMHDPSSPDARVTQPTATSRICNTQPLAPLVSIPFIQQFPKAFQDFISNTIDVRADGHCGFRAIAAQVGYSEDDWAQVRKDLIEEIQNNMDLYNVFYEGHNYANTLLHLLDWFEPTAPEANWMDSMDLGVVIASRYNLVLHTFDTHHWSCFTHLPLRSPPVPAQDRRKIAIGRVGNNHFVQVFLCPHYPVPPTSMWWHEHVSSEARGWVDSYIEQMKWWSEIIDGGPGAPRGDID